jgi:hypothetical protein
LLQFWNLVGSSSASIRKAEADAVIARHTGRNDESPADRLAARELRPANGLDKRLQRGWHVVVFHQAPADLVAAISLVTSRDQPSAVLKAAMDGDIGRRIKADNPALGQALLGYIVAVMSERLSFASRVIGVLQR